MLSFYTSRFFGTKINYHGVAVPQPNGILLLYHPADRPLKPLAEDALRVLIPWSQLERLVPQRGILSHKLEIVLRSLEGLSELPFLEESVIQLEVHAKHTEDLERFEREVNRQRNSSREPTADEVIDDARQLLEGYHGDFGVADPEPDGT